MSDAPRRLDVPFLKMHGAGNDFVMIDHRDVPEGWTPSSAAIAHACDRRKGVGADGLILVGPGRDGETDFRMTYWNADGGEAEMCGNGARCSVAFAHARGLAPAACRFDTFSGVLTGEVHGARDITVSLPGWRDLDLAVALPESPFAAHYACNTGVPHLVIPVDDIEGFDLRRWGSTFRHHEIFAPAGTNVNWVCRDDATGEFLLRTYERGVEDETLACGTGASATAVVLCHLDQAANPVAVRTRGGDLLSITVDKESGALFLRGPAVVAFAGTLAVTQGARKESRT